MYITYADAVNHLRALVEEYGADYVNEPVEVPTEGVPSCVYRHNGAPSCGVGHVLSRAGFDLDSLSEEDNTRSWMYLYRDLRDSEELFMHYETQELLRTFQARQDDRTPWGEALKSALNATHAPSVDTFPES